MNWLEARDSIDTKDRVVIVFRAMDKLQANGERLTYENISKATPPNPSPDHLTAFQIEGMLRRFRARYFKDEAFVIRAKIIARHFGKEGERKLLG